MHTKLDDTPQLLLPAPWEEPASLLASSLHKPLNLPTVPLRAVELPGVTPCLSDKALAQALSRHMRVAAVCPSQHELMPGIAKQYRMLTLLGWDGFHHGGCADLVLTDCAGIEAPIAASAASSPKGW
jgi:hypothetical protein